MATDIAFAVGVLTLLGNRVPFSLRVFLLALAIVDDLGAVLVIAVFYTEQISTPALGIAGALLGLCVFMNKAGVRNILVYVVAGIFIWLAFLKSGVHATIAGVMIGFITPIQAWLEKDFFVKQFSHLSDSIFNSVKLATGANLKESLNGDTIHALEELEFITKESRSPLDRIIHSLHPWVMFVIMPVFALGNAGIYLGNIDFNTVLHNSISLGTFLGLFLGKPLGVFLFCFLAVKLKIADLPVGVNWLQIFGVGVIAGIGFTMALFVSHLALKVPEIEAYAKIGILGASLASSIVGFFILSLAHSRAKKAGSV
jgi:NhaA family Na+:H+ antiporter